MTDPGRVMRTLWPFRRRSRLVRSLEPSPVAAAVDRGPAKSFHGRRQVIADFLAQCGQAANSQSGTICLVQGAPGAGKTALLAECVKRMKAAGWKVAHLPAMGLWDPVQLQNAIGSWRRPITTGGSAGIPGIFAANVDSNKSSSITFDILNKGRKPLLLVLDEVQTLGQSAAPPPGKTALAATALYGIHNGELSRPVMLLAGGPGLQGMHLNPLGISRFVVDSFAELAQLSAEAERAILLS